MVHQLILISETMFTLFPLLALVIREPTAQIVAIAMVISSPMAQCEMEAVIEMDIRVVTTNGNCSKIVMPAII